MDSETIVEHDLDTAEPTLNPDHELGTATKPLVKIVFIIISYKRAHFSYTLLFLRYRVRLNWNYNNNYFI